MKRDDVLRLNEDTCLAAVIITVAHNWIQGTRVWQVAKLRVWYINVHQNAVRQSVPVRDHTENCPRSVRKE